MICDGRTFSYEDFATEIGRARERMRETQIEPGQVVALTGRYNFSAGAWFLALAANRNVVVPLVGSDERDLAQRIEEAGAEWIVDCGAANEVAEERTESSKGNIQPSTFNRAAAVSTALARPATGSQQLATAGHPLVERLRENGRAGLILFSSGTTGNPKAMLHDLDTLIDSYALKEGKDLRVLAFMGIDHIGGIDIFLRGIASGSCLVVPRERSPEAICRLIAEQRVHVLPTTPSFLNLLLLSDAHRGHDLSSLTIIAFGAERMPAPVLRRLEHLFKGVRFLQKFGTSETNAIRTISKESDPLWMRIDDPAVEWKIVAGELWLKTPSRILGYLNAESDRLEADGWYRTGDLVEEKDGFFRVTGRRETMINVGGEKVLPAEVEAAIRELTAVVDCQVFSEPNPILGQVVCADVVVEEENPKEAVRLIRRHCRQKLAPHKVPVKIRVVDEIAVNERFKRSS